MRRPWRLHSRPAAHRRRKNALSDAPRRTCVLSAARAARARARSNARALRSMRPFEINEPSRLDSPDAVRARRHGGAAAGLRSRRQLRPFRTAGRRRLARRRPSHGRGNLVFRRRAGRDVARLGRYTKSVVDGRPGRLRRRSRSGPTSSSAPTPEAPLAFVAVTMPPWPGEEEAVVVAGPWRRRSGKPACLPRARAASHQGRTAANGAPV